MTTRRLRLSALAVMAGFVLTGCNLNITQWHVPGGAAEGDTYQVSAVFADVQNLIPQAQVRRQNVAVGDVVSIELRDDDMVVVTLLITDTVAVPANSVAELNSTSLLGEMYVDLRVPDGQRPQGRLEPGAQIPEGRTSLVPQFEQALAALSTVLNGSGLSQLQTIVRELNTALAGRVPETRNLIEQLTRIVGTVDDNRDAITDLLDRLDGLTSTLAQDRATIDLALTELGPGVRAVDDSLSDITELFTSIAALGDTAERVLGEITEDTVADLTTLEPIVQTLVGVRGDLILAVTNLAAAEPLIQRAIPGDFAGISGEASFAIGGLIELLQQTGGGGSSTGAARSVPTGLSGPGGSPAADGLAAILSAVNGSAERGQP